MIKVLQGPPGNGKTSVMVADMAEFLLAGGVVATNFTLAENWLDILCNSVFKYRWGLVDRNAYRQDLHNRCFRIGTVDTILELSKVVKKLSRIKAREGKGRLYLDETQLWFNSRDWSENFPVIQFCTQHRKLMWDVIMVAHDIEMLDKQIRPLIELAATMRNLRNVRILMGIPMSWFLGCNGPLFLVINTYNGKGAGRGIVHSRRLYKLHPVYRDLYDTFEIFDKSECSVKISTHGPFIPYCPVKGAATVQSQRKKIDTVRGVEVPYYQRVTSIRPAGWRKR